MLIITNVMHANRYRAINTSSRQQCENYNMYIQFVVCCLDATWRFLLFADQPAHHLRTHITHSIFRHNFFFIIIIHNLEYAKNSFHRCVLLLLLSYAINARRLMYVTVPCYI